MEWAREKVPCQYIYYNWIGFKSCSIHFMLYNDFSSFIGGGEPQNNSDWVESRKDFGASVAKNSDQQYSILILIHL